MGIRRGNGRVDQTWVRLLARLRLLASDYGEHVTTEAPSFAPVSPYAAMHMSLQMLATVAELFHKGGREGWSTLLTFVPPSADAVARAARVAVTIVEGRTREKGHAGS